MTQGSSHIKHLQHNYINTIHAREKQKIAEQYIEASASSSSITRDIRMLVALSPPPPIYTDVFERPSQRERELMLYSE